MADILYIARHGETSWNTAGLIQGRADSPLTARGKAQGLALGKALADINIGHLFHSPLERAARTAQIVSRQLACTTTCAPDLIERDLGLFEGRTKADVAREGPIGIAILHPVNADICAPEGESMRDITLRARLFLASARDHPAPVVAAITHGLMLQALLADIENDGIYDRYRHRNGAYAVIRWVDAQPKITAWNIADHLPAAEHDDPLAATAEGVHDPARSTLVRHAGQKHGHIGTVTELAADMD